MKFKQLIEMEGTLEDRAADAVKNAVLWRKDTLNFRKCRSFRAIRQCGPFSPMKTKFYVSFVESQEETDNWAECTPSELYAMEKE